MSSAPLYSKLGIEYQQAYSGLYKDLSFRVGDSRMVIAIKNGQLSGFGRPAVCFGDTKPLLPAFRKLYAANPNIWYMDWLKGGTLDEISRFLLKQDLVPKPYYTQIVDLTQSVDELHRQMRKSYKNLANKEAWAITTIAQLWWLWEPGAPKPTEMNTIIESFRQLHRKIAGRETRNKLTWYLQSKMILSREAFIVTNSDKTAMGLFIYDSDTCYYGVAASEPTVTSHAIIWEAIKWAKQLGCKELDMGEQIFRGDEKLVNISKFKRGFGGKTKLRLIFGEKE